MGLKPPRVWLALRGLMPSACAMSGVALSCAKSGGSSGRVGEGVLDLAPCIMICAACEIQVQEDDVICF